MTIPPEVPLRDRLRALPVLAAVPPAPVDSRSVPTTPQTLFIDWLTIAISAGVPEPHVMTLSTVDGDGHPDARMLICKDVDEHGWWFATDTSSAKATQLAVTPAAALTFYWPALGRQVRVRGTVRRAPDSVSATDFASRDPRARAVVHAAHDLAAAGQDPTCDDLVRQVEALLDSPRPVNHSTDLVWAAFVLDAEEVEFWQADPGRLHHRLRYRRTLPRDSSDAGRRWRIAAVAH